MQIVTHTDEMREAVIDFFAQVWPSLGWTLTPVLYPDIFSIREKYQNQGGEFWVAFRGGQIVGCVGLQRRNEDVALLRRLYVLPEHQGGFIGGRLLLAALGYARKGSFKKIRLWTRQERPNAIQLFQHARFVDIPGLPHSPRIYMELKF